MMGSLPFNLKQTYQTSSICPCSLLFSRACLKQNILCIVIITLLCRSKNVLNLIILVSLHLLPSQICNHCLLISFLTTLIVWNVNFLWNLLLGRLLLLWWHFLMLLQIVLLLLLFKVRDENQTNLLICTCLFSRLSKIVFPQSFFAISIVFSNCFKSFFKFRQRIKIFEKKNNTKQETKMVDLFLET
jgi:hypothetical protein